MKQLSILGLYLVLASCNPSYPAPDLVGHSSYPHYDSTYQEQDDFDSLGTFTLDSLFEYLDEPEDTTFMVVEDLGDDIVSEESSSEDSVDDYWAKGRTLSLNEKIESDTSNLSVEADTITVDTSSQILGVSELIFVWKGDTCTTKYLDQFLTLNDISVDPAEIKPHFLKVTLELLLHGDPTGAVIEGDKYLRSVLYGIGLDAYADYYDLKLYLDTKFQEGK